ncbi:MAG TPA: hypothetical protein VG265_12165 [Gaiellaceae bacterium]|jgi:hypothetical protein|nr:hypothetical protein [Gaiellaceae bacterium]
MKLRSLPVLAATTIGLTFSAPAIAISGYPISNSLRATRLTAAHAKTVKEAHTCQAGRNRAKVATKSGVDPKNPAPVACEQPPRSSLVLPSLSKAATAALDALG